MKMLSNKILIFGGAGYIGSHIVADLCEKGCSVTVYDNLSTGYKSNLHPDAQLITADILDRKSLSEICSRGFDTVFHFAALKAAGESMIYPESFSESNIVGSINILKAMLKYKINKIIFSSTAAVYGNPIYLPLDENHSTIPINYYGFSKLTIEHLIEWYGKIHGIQFANLRYFNAAGYDIKGRVIGKERNPQNLLPIVMEVAAGERDKVLIFGNDYDSHDGTGIRDYIHVNDLSSAHVGAMDYLNENSVNNLTVNLATGKGYSVLDVIKCAEKVTGQFIKYEIVERRDGDMDQLYANSIFADGKLNWSSEHSDLEKILSSMWSVYKPQ